MLKGKKIGRELFLGLLIAAAGLFSACQDSEEIINAKEMQTRKNAQDALVWVDEIFQKRDKCFEDFLANMSLEEKICQLFIENLEGNTSFRPVEKLKDISNNPQIDENRFIIPGGYLFFSFNVGASPKQIMNFTDSIFDFCNNNQQLPPFLAIDQEGGYVNRLRNINGPLPSAERVAEKASPEKAELLYSLQAKQMKLLGFQMNLAPLAEVCTPDNRDFLTERSFGNPQKVYDYGKSCIQAYEENNVSTVLKHFPGNTNTDPHTGLPEIKLSKEELFKELEAFAELIKENPDGILMSHARTSALDSEKPACLSYTWVTEILRNQYHYEGIIFSDDIFMAALASNGYKSEKAVTMAIEAGIDCIMVSEKRILKPAKYLYNKAKEDSSFEEKINKAAERICRYKLHSGQIEIIEDGKGGYKISSKSFYENHRDTEKRLLEFNSVRLKNQDLYEEYYK